MNHITINHKYVNKTIQFTWDGGDITIEIEKDTEVSLTDLYDYIIDNVDKVSFTNLTLDSDRDKSLAYDAYQEIISAIESEYKKILLEFNKVQGILEPELTNTEKK